MTDRSLRRDVMTGEYTDDRDTADAAQGRDERGYVRTPLIQSMPNPWAPPTTPQEQL